MRVVVVGLMQHPARFGLCHLPGLISPYHARMVIPSCASQVELYAQQKKHSQETGLLQELRERDVEEVTKAKEAKVQLV